jgi:PAN domain
VDQGEFYLLLVLAIIYLPLIVTGFWPGAGIWKFLAFVFCTLAIVSVFFAGVLAGVPVAILCWLVAWVFGGIALGSIRRTRREDNMLHAIEDQARLLQALQEQNELERGAVKSARNVAAPSSSGYTHIYYRGYTYRVAENGGADLKLSSGEWRKFSSTQDLKAYVDAVLGGGRSVRSNLQKLNPTFGEDRAVASAPAVADGQPEKTVARTEEAELTQAGKRFFIVAGGIIILVFAFLLLFGWPTGPARQVTETRPEAPTGLFTMRSNMQTFGPSTYPVSAAVRSVGECDANCARYDSCKVFTYHKVSRMCYGHLEQYRLSAISALAERAVAARVPG